MNVQLFQDQSTHWDLGDIDRISAIQGHLRLVGALLAVPLVGCIKEGHGKQCPYAIAPTYVPASKACPYM